MSWGLRRSSQRKSSRSSRSPVKADLVPVSEARLRRQPYGTSGLVHGPTGLLYAPGGPFTQPTDPITELSVPQNADCSGDNAPEARLEGGVEEYGELHSQKKEKQWKTWETETIPLLLQPYIHLLRETESLRDLSVLQQRLRRSSCGCNNPRPQNVVCIFFESKFNIGPPSIYI
jgi:hypothetical protein